MATHLEVRNEVIFGKVEAKCVCFMQIEKHLRHQGLRYSCLRKWHRKGITLVLFPYICFLHCIGQNHAT